MTYNPRYRTQKPDRISCLKTDTQFTEPLMQFISARMPQASRNDVKSWLRHGSVKVGSEVVSQFNAPVEPGVEVSVNHTRSWPRLSHPRLELVYEDDDIIVVNKGYGLLSVGTGAAHKEETAYGILKEYVKSQNPANKIFVVHRLDRATSGLMMFAKSVEAQQAMQHNWNNMVIDRRYVAVLEGVVDDDEGVMRSNLGETSQYEVYSTADAMAGKPAVTYWKVLARGGGYTLAEFSLDTGRKNQIRVHARDMGHPIVGDRKYGAVKSPLNRVALHARSLRFAHPMTRRLMSFELPVPQRFSALLRR